MTTTPDSTELLRENERLRLLADHLARAVEELSERLRTRDRELAEVEQLLASPPGHSDFTHPPSDFPSPRAPSAHRLQPVIP
jgi:hypothetical protein